MRAAGGPSDTAPRRGMRPARGRVGSDLGRPARRRGAGKRRHSWGAPTGRVAGTPARGWRGAEQHTDRACARARGPGGLRAAHRRPLCAERGAARRARDGRAGDEPHGRPSLRRRGRRVRRPREVDDPAAALPDRDPADGLRARRRADQTSVRMRALSSTSARPVSSRFRGGRLWRGPDESLRDFVKSAPQGRPRRPGHVRNRTAPGLVGAARLRPSCRRGRF
jgi:hypothetical protein